MSNAASRPTARLAVSVAAQDVLAYRKAGIVPGSVLSAVARAMDACGSLEVLLMERECREWEERRENVALALPAPERHERPQTGRLGLLDAAVGVKR